MKTVKTSLALLLSLAMTFVCMTAASAEYTKVTDQPNNLALGKETFTDASSQQSPSANAVDGDESTRWAGSTDGEQTGEGDNRKGDWWIAVKLGDEPVAFDQVTLSWENCYGKDYVIEATNDPDGTWTAVSEEHLNAGGKNRVTVSTPDACAKYMRVRIFVKDNYWGVSLYEIEVYAIPKENRNLALSRPTGDNLNGTNQNSDFANKMVDGNENTRWTGTKTDKDKTKIGEWAPWVKIGTALPAKFNTVKIKWEDCYGKTFALQTTNTDPLNGEPTWTTIGNYTNSGKGWQTITLPEPAEAIYLRIFITEKSGDTYGVGIWELQVYNLAADSPNLAAGGTAIWDDTNKSGYCGDLNASTFTDGSYKNDSNCWQPDPGVESGEVFLKFAKASDISKLVLFTESDGERYTVSFTKADVSSITEFADMSVLAWTDAEATLDYAVSRISDGTAYQEYSFAKVEGATALRLSYTGGGWKKIREIEAYNDTAAAGNTLTGIVKYQSESSMIVLANVTEEAAKDKAIRATYTITRTDGKKATGTIDIESAYAVVQLSDDLKLTAGDIPGGHHGDYLAALLITDLPEGATVAVTLELIG